MAGEIILPQDIPQNKTGYKLGSLSPVIWWEKVNGIVMVHGCPIEKHILVPPTEPGDNGALARKLYEARPHGRPSYKDQGYQWNEAGTLREVQKLQARWEAQELKVLRWMGHHDHMVRERVHKEVASRLRQRMISSSCSPFERDFIRLWLELRDAKQEEYTKKWEERIFYIQALEFDSNHKPEDRIR